MAIQLEGVLTTAQSVRDISGTAADDSVIFAFINTAHVMSTNILPSNHVYDLNTLVMIETWLACHLLSAREPLVTTERIGSTYLSYLRNQNTLGLDSTPYGQFLKMLDFDDWFKEAEKSPIIFEVLSEYDDPIYYASIV